MDENTKKTNECDCDLEWLAERGRGCCCPARYGKAHIFVEPTNKELFFAIINEEKFNKLGIKKLHDWFKENFNKRISNFIKNPKSTREMVINYIIVKKEEAKLGSLTELMNEKRKIKKNDKDFTKYKVGDEVTYTHSYEVYCCNYYCGIITKVNKASIRFKPYKIGRKESDNPNGAMTQSFEKINHYYDKENFEEEKTIRTNFETIDEVEDWRKYEFEYYTKRHDWGA